MANQFNLEVVISAIAKDISAIAGTTSAIQEAQKAAQSFVSEFKLGVAIEAAKQAVDLLIRGLVDLKVTLEDVIKDGVRFNQTLESNQIAIAAVLRDTDRVGNFKNFNQAFESAGLILDQLKKKALDMALPFEVMAQSYQIATSQMSAAGIPIKNQVDLIALLTRAVQIQDGELTNSRKILTETRDLLQGTPRPGAQLANRILGTPQDRQAFDQAKENGVLFEFLSSKLIGTAEAGSRVKASMAGLRTELDLTLKLLGADLAKPVFESTKGAVAGLLDVLSGPEISNGIKALSPVIREISDDIIGFGLVLVNLAKEGFSAFTALLPALSPLLDAFTFAVKVAELAVTQLAGMLHVLSSTLGTIQGAFTGSSNGILTWITRLISGKKAADDLANSANGLQGAGGQRTLADLKTNPIAPAANTEEETLKRQAAAAKLEVDLRDEADRAIAANQARVFSERLAAENDFYRSKLSAVATHLDEEVRIIEVEMGRANLEQRQKLETRLEGLQNAATLETAKLQNQMEASIKRLTDTEANRNQKISEAASLREMEMRLNTRLTLGLNEDVGIIQHEIELQRLTNQILAERGQTRDRFASAGEFEVARIGARQDATIQLGLKEKANNVDYLKGLADRISIQLAENEGTQEHAALIKFNIEAQNSLTAAELKSNATGGESVALQSRLNSLVKAALELNERIVAIKIQQANLDLSAAKAQTGVTAASVPFGASPEQIEQAKRIQLQNQEEVIRKSIDLQKQLQSTLAGKETSTEFIQSEIAVEGLNQKLLETQRSLKVVGSFSGTLKDGIQAWGDKIGTVAKQFSSFVTGTFDIAVNGISDGIDGLITGTQSWGEAMRKTELAIVEAFVKATVQMVAQSVIREGLRVFETTSEGVHVAARVGEHVAGEGAKTASTGAGSLARGAIHVGETIFHGIQVGIRTVAHVAGEVAKTAATIVQVGLRIVLTLLETGKEIILAAVKGMSAVADIPFVGPILAIAALAAILAAGAHAVGAFREGGYTGDGDRNAVAGTVHKGEVVIPKGVVAQHGLAHFAQYFPGGMPGYAGGGLVRSQTLGAGGGQLLQSSSVNITVADIKSRNDERDALARDASFIVLDRLNRRGRVNA